MKPPIFVRPLTDAERDAVETGLRSSNAYTLRRSQILAASARGDDIFFSATGITDGELLEGVKLTSTHAYTQSLVMRSRSGTTRRIDSTHQLDKIRRYIQVVAD